MHRTMTVSRLVIIISFATLAIGSKAIAQIPATYTIDETLSELNLTASGSVLGGGLLVTEQHAHTPTTYDGTIKVEFPSSPFASPGGAISFPGGSTATANNLQGSFLGFPLDLDVSPDVGGMGGSGPANYGVNFEVPLGGIALPDIPIGDTTISLGSLDSVAMGLALRDVVWDINTNLLNGEVPIGAGGQFDASGTIGSGVQLGITSGFADLNAALVLDLGNPVAAGGLELALGGLLGGIPELDFIDVSRDNFLSSEVDVSIGTRLDLTGIPDILTLPNGTSDPGTITYDDLTGASTLTLPVEISLPDFGIPTEILDLDLSFSGQLVANGTVTIPEPSSVSLLAISAVGCASLRRRRRTASYRLLAN